MTFKYKLIYIVGRKVQASIIALQDDAFNLNKKLQKLVSELARFK